jgi:hypothetical protein
MAISTVKIMLLVTSILFIILASWSLDTYNKLSKVDKEQVEGLCGVKSDSIQNGKNFSVIMLVASIVVFVMIVGQYAYGQYESSNVIKLGYGRMKYAF